MNRIFVSASLAFLLVLSAPVLAEDGEIAEPTSEELKSVDASLDVVRTVCSSTLDALLSELRTRYPDIVARRSGGRSQKNDYRNYQWISVRFGDREYMLAAHHGNLDTRTGNPHTQFGRIQFWRCAGPNGPHTRDADGVWRFRADNEDRTLPATHVWDEGMAPFTGNNYGIVDLPGMPGLEQCLQRFPNLKFFGHSQAFWCEIGKYRGQHVRFGYPTGPVSEGRIPQLMRKYPNLYGDLSAGSGSNALMRDRAYAAKFLTEFQDRLMFGMDICSPEGERKSHNKLSGFLRDMLAKGDITEAVFNKVVRGNAERILGV